MTKKLLIDIRMFLFYQKKTNIATCKLDIVHLNNFKDVTFLEATKP